MKTVLFMGALPSLFATLNGNNDFQVWVGESVNMTVNPKVWVNLANEWRYGDNASTLYFFYLQGLVYGKFNDWTEVAPGFRQGWRLDKETNQWLLVEEPMFNLFWIIKKGAGQIQIRHRITYEIVEHAPSSWVYQGRIHWSGKWKIRDRDLQPYLTNQVYVRQGEGFSQDRLTTGVVIPLFKDHFTVNISGMIRWEKRDFWVHMYVLGTWFEFKY